MGFWDENLFKCSRSHDQDGFQCHIYDKNIQKSLSSEPKRKTDDLESWYTASGTQVLPNLFK